MKLSVMVWNEQGDDSELFTELELVNVNPTDNKVLYVGTLQNDRPDDPKSPLEGRKVNVVVELQSASK